MMGNSELMDKRLPICLRFQQAQIEILPHLWRTDEIVCKCCAKMVIAVRRLSAYVRGEDTSYA